MQQVTNFDYDIAVICRSNQNRSMSAHEKLKQCGYNVKSYGTGQYSVLPAIGRPMCFNFGVPYLEMERQLPSDTQHKAFYTKHKVYKMLERNAKIKEAPERFQTCGNEFDLIFALDKDVFEEVVDFFYKRNRTSGKLCYIFYLHIEDSFESAEKAASEIVEFLKVLERAGDWTVTLDNVLKSFNNRSNTKIVHVLQMY